MEDVKEKVIAIIKEIDPITEFDNETDLLEEILDSMSIVYLLAEVQQQLHIEIPMSEITAENFSTLNHIVELICRYM